MAAAAPKFVPRATFAAGNHLPRSYFLGHHAAGLQKMKTMVGSVDLVIECRDYRVPLSSRNPLFEQALVGRNRLIVYTKHDLGSKARPSDYARDGIIREWHAPWPVVFSERTDGSLKLTLEKIKTMASSHTALTGFRAMVVGMPNVGKSTLLNALRATGLSKPKVAKTGGQPGVTRKIATEVKIVEGTSDGTPPIYLVDTPGVFMPYVADAETMLKLALVGSVKDTIIRTMVLMDYWLYLVNKRGMANLYLDFMPNRQPTNDIEELVAGACQRVGKLGKGGLTQMEAGVLWLMQRFRNGELGRFVLDEIDEGSLRKIELEEVKTSLSQARKLRKEALVHRARTRAGTSRGAGEDVT